MFYLSFALGLFIGTVAGVVIMCLMIISSESSKPLYSDKHCNGCDIFNDPNSDTSYCLSCTKGDNENV